MKETEQKYSYLHVHSKYSLATKDKIISPSSPEELSKAAKDNGIENMALTDNNFFGLGRFLRASMEVGIKPLIGIELPISTIWEAESSDITLIAQNNEGLNRIFNLASDYHLFGRRPEINDLTGAEGEIVTLLRGNLDLYKDLFNRSDIFIALDNSRNIENYIHWEKETGKVVVSDEVRLADTGQARLYQMIYRLFMNNKKNGAPHDSSIYMIKSPRVIYQLYGSIPKSIERANEIARNAKVDFPLPPHIKAKIVPQNENSFEYLKKITFQAMNNIPNSKSFKERVNKELEFIRQLNFSDYLLICMEITNYCKDNNIRFLTTGSGNNSVVLNLMGITNVQADNLMFERFINMSRVDFPDVDIALPFHRRPEVVNYVLNRYNNAVLLSVVKELKKDGLNWLSSKNNVSFTNEEVQEMEDTGIPFQVSTHPSGIIFADHVPKINIAGNNLAQFDTEDVESIFKWPKIDLLHKISLARIERIGNLINKDHLEYTLPVSDNKSLERLFISAKTLGISDTESAHLRKTLKHMGEILRSKEIEPTVDTLAQVLALARPNITLRNRYFINLSQGNAPFSHYPEISQITKHTNFVIIYQEQLMKIATDIAGLSLGYANQLRKLLNSDLGENQREELLLPLKEKLTEKYPQEIVNEILMQMKSFASFGFLEGHAKALASSAYELAYLSEKYPAYFWSEVLRTVSEKPNSHYYPLQAYVNEALRDGVHFKFPPISELPDNPYVNNHGLPKSITVGRSIFPKVNQFTIHYDQFYSALRNDKYSIKDIVNYQLRHFGVSYTYNPIVLFDQRYLFDPGKDRQEIIGLFITGRSLSTRVFSTIDSGNIVDLIIPSEMYHNNYKKFKKAFWKVTIKRNQDYPDSWDVMQVGNIQ